MTNKTALLYQNKAATLPNDTKALNKHIVSFSEQLCKRNTRSTLAVIFIPNFKEDTI